VYFQRDPNVHWAILCSSYALVTCHRLGAGAASRGEQIGRSPDKDNRLLWRLGLACPGRSTSAGHQSSAGGAFALPHLYEHDPTARVCSAARVHASDIGGRSPPCGRGDQASWIRRASGSSGQQADDRAEAITVLRRRSSRRRVWSVCPPLNGRSAELLPRLPPMSAMRGKRTFLFNR
jgi:hypothetical protein